MAALCAESSNGANPGSAHGAHNLTSVLWQLARPGETREGFLEEATFKLRSERTQPEYRAGNESVQLWVVISTLRYSSGPADSTGVLWWPGVSGIA